MLQYNACNRMLQGDSNGKGQDMPFPVLEKMPAHIVCQASCGVPEQVEVGVCHSRQGLHDCGRGVREPCENDAPDQHCVVEVPATHMAICPSQTMPLRLFRALAHQQLSTRLRWQASGVVVQPSQLTSRQRDHSAIASQLSMYMHAVQCTQHGDAVDRHMFPTNARWSALEAADPSSNDAVEKDVLLHL